MDTDSTMRLIYLGLLGSVIGFYVFVSHRHRMGQMLQQAAIWFFIFVGFVVVYGFWNDIRDIALPGQSVVAEDGALVVSVPRQRDGHYHLTLIVNGATVPFIVDTGATDLVLTRQDAARVGLDPDTLRYLGRANTANGSVETAEVRLDEVQLGQILDRNVPAVVNGGDMRQSLLGMSYLQSFGRIEIENDELRLIR
ncbi:TIGR02281 family clan AA aspartic protease [Jannaschia sp. M317]|uniref:retropepsin-like aspartic protease family protein n=1 Tax=Jannaschia sp. M317 TaxID=2867011 RepID=UPI0021A3CA8A|nr:TIGR02281 family clan AA aspartic protease [Jannaschia sp. M317]UWQ17149.1 TIGR02281 family clan AA aspartic protease [Jannaschia sp. M317]